jgi:hypothetical protein
MKNLIAGLAAALFVLTLSGCDGILSSPKEGDGLFSDIEQGTVPNNNGGQLTITNIDYDLLYTNWSVYICYSGSETNPESNYEAYGTIYIDSYTAAIDLYTGSGYRWTGSGSYYVYLVSDKIAAKSSSSIYFSNGNAAIDANQLGLLTASSNITNITYNSVSGGTWVLQSDGRRKSPTIGDGNVTKFRVNFTSTANNAAIVIQLDVSSEGSCDFAFIGQLDNASVTYESGYYPGSRISGTNSATVSIPVPFSGSHFIEIGYRKDGSISNGSDCAWFKVIW